jgi:hypothetical protein
VPVYSVYYMKSEFFSVGVKGYDWLKQNNRVPNIADLNASHVHLIDLEADKLEDLYLKMQGEDWNPTGDARGLIAAKGARHTSMAVGDIAIDCNSCFAYLVDRAGFKFLGKAGR